MWSLDLAIRDFAFFEHFFWCKNRSLKIVSYLNIFVISENKIFISVIHDHPFFCSWTMPEGLPLFTSLILEVRCSTASSQVICPMCQQWTVTYQYLLYNWFCWAHQLKSIKCYCCTHTGCLVSSDKLSIVSYACLVSLNTFCPKICLLILLNETLHFPTCWF